MDKERRFASHVAALSETLGHADRVEPLGDYCRGLMLSGDRKSVEPMAALVAPQRAGAKHQSMHHFVAKADWSDAAMLAAVREQVLPALGAIEAWIVDDTGYPKMGSHSVGVARQYCGQLGKQDNCQVAVSVSVANERSSLPIGYQELKQELGLGHYEGRNWRGFHHHATLTIAAYGFLMRARLTGRAKKNSAFRPREPLLRLPPRLKNFIPRGSPRAA
jgi:SRSO17 transposase